MLKAELNVLAERVGVLEQQRPSTASLDPDLDDPLAGSESGANQLGSGEEQSAGNTDLETLGAALQGELEVLAEQRVEVLDSHAANKEDAITLLTTWRAEVSLQLATLETSRNDADLEI